MQYFCNLFAEWMKSDDSRLTWRNRLLLEVLIPGFSLVMLLSVTIYVTNEAIDVLIHDSTDHDSVNVFYLYGFATGNLVVDIISSYYFCAKGGSDVFVTYHHPPAFTLEENVSTSDDQALILRKGYARQPESVKADDISTNNYVDLDGAQQPQPKPNLNMVSAFTHLGGDTIRTLSVFVAAVVSTAAGIPSQTCDAWAAIVVSGTIVLIAFPLVKEIMTAYARLAQERNSS
jgi:Co/Zn/Cd efflux system component